MRKILAAALLFTTVFFGSTRSVAAQTPQVEAGKPFSIASAVTADPNTDNFDLVIDGAVVATKPVSAIANGDITFANITAPPRGSHSVVIRATNVDGLVTDSDPTVFSSVKGKPNKPGKPRIVSGLLAMLKAPVTLIARLFDEQGQGFGPIRITQ